MAQYRKDTHKYLPQETTIYEVVMLADQYGNLVGPANPSGTAVDAFGRARVSEPFTLFDSSYRYRDNGKWSTSNNSSTTVTFNKNAGLMELSVATTANAEVIRETDLVFSYQPGKSLQILQTFVFAPAQTNLRQRTGYYGADNGIYLELANNSLAWVERSNVSGTIQETRAYQEDWNIDTLLGDTTSSPSLISLDISKAQIMFIDLEWLGLGTVRCGFVIDGRFIHTHSFHHANRITSTYITTACLPLRYEIKNIGVTGNNSTLKQVCSTVMSEAGYNLRGEQRAAGIPANTSVDLPTAGIPYPVVSLRLKSTNLDAIVIPSAVSLLGIGGVGNSTRVQWRLVEGATLNNSSWVAVTNSAVEYDISANGMYGGTVVAQGYIATTNQSTSSISLPGGDFFKYQLERNGLTGVARNFTLAAVPGSNGDDVLGSLDWDEVTQ